MDSLSAASQLPGRCPSLRERLGLRPACSLACTPGLPRTPSVHSARMLSGLRRGFGQPRIAGLLRSACPEGASVRSAKAGHPRSGSALVAKDVHRPTIFSPLRLSAQRANCSSSSPGRRRTVGPLGRRVIENGRMDYLSATTQLPGRCPSLRERLGLRPACCSACVPGLPRTPAVYSARLLSGLRRGFGRPRISGVPRSACPEGASVRPAKGTALVAKDAHRPTIFPPLCLSAQRASRSPAMRRL